MKILQVIFVLSFTFASALAQETRSATDIMAEAFAKAEKEKKNVFVKFSASWCGWCHKMDASMKDSACKKFFEDNFVMVQLIVDEANEKKTLENPGADEYRARYNGDKNQGIPFWFILDTNGKLLGDCYIRKEGQSLTSRGQNSGCPANEAEVKNFITVLKKTSNLNTDQLRIISERFRRNETKTN